MQQVKKLNEKDKGYITKIRPNKVKKRDTKKILE